MMEEQIPVPQQTIPTQNNIPQPAPHRRSNGNKFILILFSMFILLFTGAAGYLFGYQQARIQYNSEKAVSNPANKKTVSTPTQNIEVTKKTKIAKSLAVPKLDPNLQWSDETKIASDDGLMEIMADKFDEQYMLIPFKLGKYYIATGAASMDPNSYFTAQLKHVGWVTPDSKDTFLTFKSFRLRGLIADGTCGGVVGYVGYKDGMVRMITIKQAAQTCLSPDKVKNIISLKQQTAYNVFVSDPTSVQYFSNFVTTHVKK